MQITAAVVEDADAPFVLGNIEIAEPREGEVLVRIVAVGVCHTDLVARSGGYPTPFPCVLGHEGSGVVHSVGPGVTKVSPGDHVVLTFNSCGSCTNCRRGAEAYCVQLPVLNALGRRADGTTAYRRDEQPISGHFFSQSSFATFSLATERNVVKVPTDLPLQLLGPLGCGIQTGAGTVLNSLAARPGESIVITGTGSVGLSAVMAARIAGCDPIIAIDLLPERLELAAELGATHVFAGSLPNLANELWQITGTGLDYAVDFTSDVDAINTGLLGLHSRGICALGGSTRIGTTVTLDMMAIHLGRTVRGVIEGDSVPDVFIPQLLAHYRAGRFPFDRLVTYFRFDEINDAIHATHNGHAVKAVLTMPGMEALPKG